MKKLLALSLGLVASPLKSKRKITKGFVWSVFPLALVLMLSLQPGRAQATLALPNFDYNFESLINNQTIFGQDKWVNLLGGGGVSVRQGLGVNQTQTAKGDGGNLGTGARRPLDQAFYYTTKDTKVVWGVWGYVPSGGNNVTAIGGLSPCYFGPHQLGGLTKLTTFLQRQAPLTYVTGDVLLHDHWYEYRVIVDFSVSGGSATLSYRDVTSGATAFTNDSVIKNVNLGLVPDSSGRYGFFDVIVRNDGVSYVDNLHFDAPAPSAACVPPRSGFVSWWPGDGNANDITDGNNGMLVKGATFAAGKVGQAFSLDGVDDGVQLAKNTFDGLSSFTVDAWVRFDQVESPTYDGQAFIVAREAGVANYFTFVKFNTAQPFGASFSNKLYLETKVGSNVCGYVASTSYSFLPGHFYHIAVTKSAGTVTFYVDGAQLGSQITDNKCNGAIATNTGFTFIGRHDGPNLRAFGGLIDEVELFDRTLSSSEIQTIFNAGSAGKCKCVTPPSDLVSWWPGDGNANDNKDGNNGTLINGAIFSAGKVGQAFSFDGVNDYVELGQPVNLMPSNTDFTVVGWILVPDYPNNSPEPRCSSYYPVIGFDWGWNIRVTGEGRVSFGKYTALQAAVSVLSTSPISTNTFHHFAAVHTVSELRIYVDGVLAGTQASLTGTIFYYGGPDTLQIGQVHCGIGKWNGKGLIDELAFYSRALTASEIQGISNAGSAGNCKAVVSPNKPPLANAGPDQTVEATSASGASVTLNGSGSSDPDSNPLTYNWTGPFGTASAVSPTLALSLGTHTVTLKVSDGQATATDTVNITVRDTTPPDTIINSAVDGNGTALASGGSTLSGSITLTFGGTDVVGVAGFQCSRDGSVFAPCTSPAGYSALAIGSHTFHVRAVDATGNVDASPASFTWTVITPAQAIQNLITTINNMGLPGGVATSLTAPLSNVNTNNKAAACAKLGAFINQVNAKVQNGQLTPAQAGQLSQAANAVKASLGC